METTCGGKQRNGVKNNCLSLGPSGKISYKVIPSLLPGFHGSLFLNIQQGTIPAEEKVPRSAPGKGLGSRTGSMRDSQILAEHFSPKSKSNNETDNVEKIHRNLLGICPKPLMEINTSRGMEEGVGI